LETDNGRPKKMMVDLIWCLSLKDAQEEIELWMVD